MNKNLGWKLAVSVGLTWWSPCSGLSVSLKTGPARVWWRPWQQRIHLGLDLKGGTHLILQVQVNDAVNVDSDNAEENLKQALRAHKINYTDISKPDPATIRDKIVIKGVPPESTSDLRSIVEDRLPEYNATSEARTTPGRSP